MSGFVRNDWDRYLNGGTSHYNFSYKSEATLLPESVAASVPVSVPPTPVVAPEQTTSQNKKNTKNKIVFPVQKSMKGGKRKSKHSHKKHRRTHRK